MVQISKIHLCVRHIPAQQSKTLHRVSGFEKPSTGTGLLKHTYQHHNQLSAISMRFKTTLPVRVFCKANPKAISLSVFLHFHHILAQASMYVQKPSACRDFCCQTYIHTRLAVNMKRYAKPVCFKNPSACRGKCKLSLNASQ